MGFKANIAPMRRKPAGSFASQRVPTQTVCCRMQIPADGQPAQQPNEWFARIMFTSSSGQPCHNANMLKSVAEPAPRYPRSQWTQRLPDLIRLLKRSEKATAAWRVIAGGTRPGEAHGLLKAWPAWERFARYLWPVCDIPGAPYGLLCLRITSYLGEPVVLPDTTTIRRGTIIGELHCNNRAVLALVKQRGNAFAACRQDLKKLSDWIQQDPLARRIEALYACTILNRAADRLGFTVLPKPVTLRRRLEKFFFKGLLLLYSREGLTRIEHGRTTDAYPVDVWLSRGEFLRLYGKERRLGRAAARRATNGHRRAI